MMKIKTCLCCLVMLVLLASTAMASCKVEEDHRYGSWKTKTSATCTRQGHQFRYCQKCDHWEQRHTSKLPHTPGEMTVTKEPTCAETGKQQAVCTVCGNLVRYTMDKLPHNLGEMTVTLEPTCVKKGKGEQTCADCGYVKRSSIEELGHDWGETVTAKAPTCKTTGTNETPCLRCDKKQTEKTDKLQHVYGDWTVTREPEGKRKGLRTGACTLCGATREENFFYEGTLYEGMAPCEEVITLQEQLRDLGFYKGAIRSGQYGELTTGAVARFQEKAGLEATGVAYPETIRELESIWEAATGKSAVKALDAAEMETAEQAQMIGE